jgi:hypothetical protein
MNARDNPYICNVYINVDVRMMKQDSLVTGMFSEMAFMENTKYNFDFPKESVLADSDRLTNQL